MNIDNFIVAFDATEAQIKTIRKFCTDKTDCNYFISVRQALTEDMELSISMFTNKPDLYIGIYSAKDNTIVESVQISNEELEYALNALDLKYAHAMTRKDPVANKKLATAWITYLNSTINQEKIKHPIIVS